MSYNSLVVVFPSVFAKNKINPLMNNIKKILKINDQQYSRIKRDDSVITVEANDPVFASTAINLLFGIQRVAIAKQVKNSFDTLVSEITKIGSNLLLKGEKFYVRVDGDSSGYTTKDVEIAVTSSLIEKTVKLGSKPGSEEKHDKLLYTYLTKSNGYVCIFSDKGHGGIPSNFKSEKIVCCVYDELSAVSCLETIKEGFEIKIIVCYRQESEVLNLVKMLNQILPRLIKSKIELEFFKVKIKGKSVKSLLSFVDSVTEILVWVAKKNNLDRISLALSPLIFPLNFFEYSTKRVFESKLIPHIPICGLDENIFETAKEIGLAKYLPRIEKLGQMKFSNEQISLKDTLKIAQKALNTKKVVSVTMGPNTIHDIMDSLELDH